MATVIPVILSGGSGTRLWPLSRKAFPKQFLDLCSEQSMLQETVNRVTHLHDPIIVCNEDHRFTVAEQLQQVGVSPSAIILEPVGRNTAPAVMLAALKAHEIDPDATIIVLAADHVIRNVDAFREVASKAIEQAQSGHLVTFGVVPTKPETGYGYIQAEFGSEKPGKVLKFVEKPDAATAESYIKAGDFLWNSGMFVFRASSYLSELSSHRHDIYSAVEKAWKQQSGDYDFIRVDKASFAESDDESIDYAVMEHTQNAVVVPLDADWSDVGSFASLWEVSAKDESGNACKGDIQLIDSRNNLVLSENQLVTAVGVDDLVIVSTKDAVMVSKRDRVQDVKGIVQELKANNRSEYMLHREVNRPWGAYDSIDKGERFQVKRIVVKPGQQLSKQMHHHRAEHWIIVSGTAQVEINDQEQLLTENESVYIPLGATHRLTNPGKIPLELIEVQSGSYLGEDDIVRFDDLYERV